MRLKSICVAGTVALSLAAGVQTLGMAPAHAMPNNNCAAIMVRESYTWSLVLFWQGLAAASTDPAEIHADLQVADSWLRAYNQQVRGEAALGC